MTRSIVLALAVWVSAGTAQAAVGPANQASLLLGYGFDDAYNLSVGVRALHALQGTLPITVGGSLNYYFGSSVDLPDGFTGPSPSVSAFTLLGEAGYEIRDAGLPVVLRPYVGLGLFVASVDPGTGDSVSNSEFGFVPGIVAEYALNSSWFAGGDLRVNIVNDNTALAVFGLVGTRF
jgi:hypothetical protein